jgi:hypothetical protein
MVPNSTISFTPLPRESDRAIDPLLDANSLQSAQAKSDLPINRNAEVDLNRILNLPGRALLTEIEVAAVLRVSVFVLREWRRRNIGPRYLKINGRAVRYRLSDLTTYQDLQPIGGGGSGSHKAPQMAGKS